QRVRLIFTYIVVVLGDLGGLLSFWSELGWLELPSGEPYQWHYVQRKFPADKVRRQAQGKKKMVVVEEEVS
ncbi:jg26082, partial [Pararge aegeria aegeria]